MEPDPTIDKSPAQKRMHLDKLRAELLELGYSVVKTSWLQDIIDGRFSTAVTLSESNGAPRL